jgi:integrase
MNILTRLSHLADLNKPEEIRTVLANANWKNSTKNTRTKIYDNYLKWLNIKWEMPIYKTQSEIPFIPTEEQINTLIAGATNKTATLLIFLKETAVRIGEALNVQWTDIDYERRTVYIRAEKGSNSRLIPLSPELIGKIKTLPNNKNTIFTTREHGLNNTLVELRKRVANKTGDKRLLKIHFHTFRHWKATMEYHKTKDIIHVKTLLGHKAITSTMIYINIESALWLQATDDWTSKVSHNIEEEQKLIEAGFQLVRSINETTAIYKKRK